MFPTVLLLLYDFLSWKNDVTVPSKSNNKHFVDILKITDESRRIRIRTKISWIRNTAKNPLNPFVGGGDGSGEHAREDGGGHVQASSVSLQDVSTH